MPSVESSYYSDHYCSRETGDPFEKIPISRKAVVRLVPIDNASLARFVFHPSLQKQQEEATARSVDALQRCFLIV
jgi:hypothetical protein